MDLPAYAKRMDGDGARRAAHQVAAFVASVWRAPMQRRLGLALAAAALSAIAFARIAEDYLTNDPLARWDVSFARWLSGERSNIGTDFFRVPTFVGSPAAACDDLRNRLEEGRAPMPDRGASSVVSSPDLSSPMPAGRLARAQFRRTLARALGR